MPRFADRQVSEFLDALASPDPTPGGGTAAAIAAAMGASLLMMVAGLPKTRGNTEGEKAAMTDGRAALAVTRDRLIALGDEDTAAFDQVLAAYRSPKSTDAEKAARKQAIQQALQRATDVPLETLRATVDAVSLSRTVAQFGIRTAASDVRVALELLLAAGAGATANVEINLNGIDDEAYRKASADAVMELTNRLTADGADARAALN